MKRNENIIVWSFFSIILIGTYTLLSQQPNEAISSKAYFISIFVSISLTFLLDYFLKNRKAKAEKESTAKKSHPKKDSKKSASANPETGSASKRSKNAKHKKKNKK